MKHFGIRVGDVGAPTLASVDQDSTLAEAARLMRDRDLGSVAVTEGDTVIGILTERDVLTAAANEEDFTIAKASRYMTDHPAAIPIDADVSMAALAMVALHARHLPIVDGDRVVGMVSARDLVTALTGNVTPGGRRMSRSGLGRLRSRAPKLAAGE